MTNSIKVDKHIDTLDGIRAVAMTFVVWFHFWQQCWLTPVIQLPQAVVAVTRYIGIESIHLDRFVRYGFVFVDLLILLSAFCNFYPYARSILLGEAWQDTKTFYKKRAVRILPSYYFCLVVCLLIVWAEGGVFTVAVWKDLLAHVFCVAPLFPETYISPYFNGVLWTVQIEVLYYVAMPWLAKLFRKWPVFTCLGLWGIGVVSANYIVYHHADNINVYGNHPLTFAGCYGNGMLLAMIYVLLKKSNVENAYTRMIATVVFVVAVLRLNGMLEKLAYGELQVVQLQQRFALSLVFSAMLLSLPFACKALQFIFENAVMRFVATISYNWYIWHQYIAVKLKTYRIPYWEGEVPPNQYGDTVWMWKYQILIVVVSIVIAIVITYGLEKPVAKYFLQARLPARQNALQQQPRK